MKPEQTPSYLHFDRDSYPWKPGIDYKKHPEKYRVGKGEQGVLICEPYKSEMTPHWRFKTPEIAEASSKKILRMFKAYMKEGDFVGADMARKFLQMGYTRARRYANYKGGKKYNKAKNYELNRRGTGDPEKAKSAAIFYKRWKEAESLPAYATQKKEWRSKHG